MGSDLDHCPYCGRSLQGFGCVYCNVEFVMEDDKLVERGLSQRGERAERRCTACDQPMSGGGAVSYTHLTLPTNREV